MGLPDFVITGAADPAGGVVLLASRELSQIVVESNTELIREFTGRIIEKITTHELGCTMLGVLWVRAATYPEAFSILQQHWADQEGMTPHQKDLRRQQFEGRWTPPEPPRALEG